MQKETRSKKTTDKEADRKQAYEEVSQDTGNMHVKRTYKSRLFEMIFSEKRALLELYNAMNGTEYENPELLEINTLENAIYMSMRNDL